MAAGSRKKSSVVSQSTTILSFFTSAASSSKQPAPRKVFKPKRRKSSAANNRPANEREIIVIDSDSDDEAESSTPQKKQKRSYSESSGEIEFVERTLAQDSKPPPTSGIKSSSTESEAIKEEPDSTFGKPTNLLLDPTSTASGSPGSPSVAPVVQQPSAPFGKPAVLLLTSRSNILDTVSDPNTADASRDAMLDGDEEAFEADEWGTGDDEIFQGAEEEEGLEDEVQELLLERHATPHTPDTQVSRAPTPKPLRPLSSLGALKQADVPSKAQGTGCNAYSVLMSSHKENEAWKEASVVEDRSFRPSKNNGGRRKAPFYKILQGMPIAVDAFKYGTIPGVQAYFLTHAHSDHYTNLNGSWKSGPIYCSEGTANLIMHMLKVDRKWVHPLPMDVPTEIPNTGGVRVTLIEANHCPGSCLFFYEGKQTIDAGDSTYKSAFVGSSKTFRYLHCGDFRASPRHTQHPAVKGKKIDHVYLDTTYLDPKYTFPPQPLVISACAELAKRIENGDSVSDQAGTMNAWVTSPTRPDVKGKQKAKPDKILMVVGTYSIGKERIVKAIAKALQSKIYCDARKTAILRCEADPELHAMLTKDPLSARVHVVPLGHVNLDKLKEYAAKYKNHFSKVVGFRPTGWTYTQPAGTDQVPSVSTIISRAGQNHFTYSDLRQGRGSSSTLQVYPVPYSEHSSFLELTCFAMSFEWVRMIATVNVGSEASRGKMAKWVERWEAERKKRGRDYTVPNRQPDYW